LSRSAALIVVTIGLGTFSCNVVGPSGTNENDSRYECGIPTGTPGTITPRPTLNGGMVFCPVQIDDGSGPFRGPFVLTGQVAGIYPQGRQLALFVRIDSATCDTEGRPGASGRFLLKQVVFPAVQISWSYADNFGDFAPGITLGRIYEFATMTATTRQTVESLLGESSQNGIDDEDMPPDVTFLSKFEVPPGVAAESVPCD
jgi:hypothetical protein